MLRTTDISGGTIGQSHNRRSSAAPKSVAGFTVIELAIVVVMVGILGAIAAPGWQLFRDRQTVNTVNERLHLAIRDAQNRSVRTKSNWRASLRQTSDRIEWAVHRKDESPRLWEGIQASVTIENGTTFASNGGNYYVEFNERGRINGQLGRVTVTSNNAPTIQRCTIASTLLGTLRRGKSHDRPQDGHTCY
jgi:type II secretory pathway pseudopilin PulG